MPKVCDVPGVRGGDTGFAVQLIFDDEEGRFALRGINEGGFSCVDIDLLDVVHWLSSLHPGAVDEAAIATALNARKRLK